MLNQNRYRLLVLSSVIAAALTMSSCGGGSSARSTALNPDLLGSISTSTSDTDTTSNTTEALLVTSSELTDGAAIPDDLKCERDGGDGVSPPLAWSNAPDGTAGFAVLMYHYPTGAVEGVDTPNHYWLLWNIGSSVSSLSRGNTESVGTEGSDKDGIGTGYTPPCSPSGSGTHEYTIMVYALSAQPTSLGSVDTVSVDYDAFISAVTPLSLATGTLSFTETN